MASYTATTAQTVAAGEAVVWQNTIVKGNCNIQHRNGTTGIKVRGTGCMLNPKVYEVSAHVVLTAIAAVPMQMALALDGEVIPGSTIAVVPAAIGDVISATTIAQIPVDCGCSHITLVAITAGVPVTSAIINVDEVT